MDPDSESSPNGNGLSAASRPPTQQKRSRIVLSCGPCRVSKLKCDRGQPCSQCLKKARIDLCVYAPKPERKRPAKGMAARVRRLEGMVRDMMDLEAGQEAATTNGKRNGKPNGPPVVGGQVVQFDHAATYVGATHCLAMLEDIHDIKSYFEDADDEEDSLIYSPMDDADSPEILISAPRSGPRNRDELIACLPDRKIVDRIIMRYFESSSPSQHVMHRPSFAKMYARFWQDPNDVPMHWLAQLYMMLSLGLLFSMFSAPHEVAADSEVPPLERMKEFRNYAGLALVWGKYGQPTMATLPAFLLYVESLFMFNRATAMPCYILSGVCIRLMLKMGLHRDPSKLANISIFDGEMRRRAWNMAIQIELLVSFHMGLPSMVNGIETDTISPRNLHDDDFDEDSTELPPSRPPTDWTSILYPIHKTQILKTFGKIGQQSHALSPPNYSDVLTLDKQLQQIWQNVPSFMKVRPLESCVGDPPVLLIQRFGLGALYDKCRCVLHRRYLSEPVLKPEHDYSRRQCIEGAMTLLRNQFTIWQACKPDGSMAQTGWFVSSLSIHDYLLAAVVIYVIIQNERYSPDGDWLQDMSGMPSKDELKDMMKKSYYVWLDCSRGMTELKKTAATLAVMLNKVGCPVEGLSSDSNTSGDEGLHSSSSTPPFDASSTGPDSSVGTFPPELASLSSFDLNGSSNGTAQPAYTMEQTIEAAPTMDMSGLGMTADGLSTSLDMDQSWLTCGDGMDWRYLDISLASSYHTGNPESTQSFMERPQANGVDMMAPDPWSQFTGMADNGFQV